MKRMLYRSVLMLVVLLWGSQEHGVLGAIQQAYQTPPGGAVEDHLTMEISMAYSPSGTNQLIALDMFHVFAPLVSSANGEPAFTATSSSVYAQAYASIAAIERDMADVLRRYLTGVDVSLSAVHVVPINTTAFLLRFENTDSPKRIFDVVLAALTTNDLFRSTQVVADSLYVLSTNESATRGVLTGSGLRQRFYYRTEVVFDLVDRTSGLIMRKSTETGFSQSWDRNDIASFGVSNGLREDIASGIRFHPSTIEIASMVDLAEAGARRVRVRLFIIAEFPNLPIGRNAAALNALYPSFQWLDGRKELSHTSVQLSYRLEDADLNGGVDAVFDVVKTGANARDDVSGSQCGSGCMLPAILWATYVFLMLVNVFVAFSGALENDEVVLAGPKKPTQHHRIDQVEREPSYFAQSETEHLREQSPAVHLPQSGDQYHFPEKPQQQTSGFAANNTDSTPMREVSSAQYYDHSPGQSVVLPRPMGMNSGMEQQPSTQMVARDGGNTSGQLVYESSLPRM